jgi:hypothetical protein
MKSKEELALYAKEYRLKNKDRLNEYNKNRRRTVDKEKKYLSMIKHKYGATPELYYKMYNEQNGVCKICNKPPSNNKRLHLDHCHKTGKIRGLLCAQCNWFIGKLDKNPGLIWELIYYDEGAW